MYPDANLGAGGAAGVVRAFASYNSAWGSFSCTATLINCPGSGAPGDPYPLGTFGSDYRASGLIREVINGNGVAGLPGSLNIYVTNVNITANPANGGPITGELDIISDGAFPTVPAGSPAGLLLRGSFIGAGGGPANAADSLTASMFFDTGVGGVLNPAALSDTATAGLLAPNANGRFALSSIGVLGGGGAFSLEADLRFTLAPGDRISLPGSVEMVDDTPLTEVPEPAAPAVLFGAGAVVADLLRRGRSGWPASR